jgi:hypothetical protein
MFTEEEIRLTREVPIENLLKKARNIFFSTHAALPPAESIANFKSLVMASEHAMTAIVRVDSKVRPTHEWLAAVDKVEAIRNEALEMIAKLQR